MKMELEIVIIEMKSILMNEWCCEDRANDQLDQMIDWTQGLILDKKSFEIEWCGCRDQTVERIINGDEEKERNFSIEKKVAWDQSTWSPNLSKLAKQEFCI